MSLIFCGDLTFPYDCNIDYSNIQHIFKGKTAIANLEGNILPNRNELYNYKFKDKYSVYSQPNVIKVLQDLNIKYVSLCNNHIMDYKYPLEKTITLLEKNHIKSWGVNNHDIIKTQFNGKSLYIITFSTCANDHALNLYNPDKVVEDIKKLKKEDCYVVVYPHWGIERLNYVEPADRHHAHRMINAGADLIIGHHPHIIQQIEIYKGKTIIYSLGNFIFPQTYYGNKKLIFNNPDILKELLIEWNGIEVKYHYLIFNPTTNILTIDTAPNPLQFISHEVSDIKYLKFYKSKVNIINFYWLRRFNDSRNGEIWCYIRRQVFRLVRKFLIKLKLHTPK